MKINKEEILDFLNKSDLHDIVVEQNSPRTLI